MNALYLPARAKLNLTLRIVGRREDGYHLLETLYHAIDWHDDLWMAATPKALELEVVSGSARSTAPVTADNLVVRALDSLRIAVGATSGFCVRLHKRIPTGGGLGGGSSDAAAALRLGNALLGAPLDGAALVGLARRLGADVPFFLAGGSQWGTGIGDELAPVAVAARHFVLVVPPFECPTAEVYKNHGAHWNDGRPQVSPSAASITTTSGHTTPKGVVRVSYSNDLERAAEIVRPALSELRQRAAELGEVSVHLTGSGSTLFVGHDDEAAAARCARALRPLEAEGVRIVRTVSAVSSDVPVSAAWPDDPGDRAGRWRSRAT